MVGDFGPAVPAGTQDKTGEPSSFRVRYGRSIFSARSGESSPSGSVSPLIGHSRRWLRQQRPSVRVCSDWLCRRHIRAQWLS